MIFTEAPAWGWVMDMVWVVAMMEAMAMIVLERVSVTKNHVWLSVIRNY